MNNGRVIKSFFTYKILNIEDKMDVILRIHSEFYPPNWHFVSSSASERKVLILT